MSATPRRRLRALATHHGLSDLSLTLIRQAALPGVPAGERLTDTQIGVVHEAVEVCVLSGLAEQQVEPAMAEHRAGAPQDWERSFWRERLALANEHYNEGQTGKRRLAPPSPAAQRPPVAPIGPEPPHPRPAPAAPVSPIPPQPPGEVGSGAREPTAALAAQRHRSDTAAPHAA
jgi:hypothetical protein